MKNAPSAKLKSLLFFSCQIHRILFLLYQRKNNFVECLRCTNLSKFQFNSLLFFHNLARLWDWGQSSLSSVFDHWKLYAAPRPPPPQAMLTLISVPTLVALRARNLSLKSKTPSSELSGYFICTELQNTAIVPPFPVCIHKP